MSDTLAFGNHSLPFSAPSIDGSTHVVVVSDLHSVVCCCCSCVVVCCCCCCCACIDRSRRSQKVARRISFGNTTNGTEMTGLEERESLQWNGDYSLLLMLHTQQHAAAAAATTTMTSQIISFDLCCSKHCACVQSHLRRERTFLHSATLCGSSKSHQIPPSLQFDRWQI